MNKFLFFLVLIQSSFGLEITTIWTEKFEKEVTFNCKVGDNQTNFSVCEQICDAKVCTIKEQTCKNCFGKSMYINFIFDEIGKFLISTDSFYNSHDLYNLVSSSSFITLTSNSVYNLAYSFDDSDLKKRFQSLCDNTIEYPVVFFEMTNAGDMGKPLFVFCGGDESNLKALEYLGDNPTLRQIF